MFRVFVGSNYLRGILGYRRFNLFSRAHGSKINALFTRKHPQGLLSKDDLAELTVFDVLEWFHDQISSHLKAEPAVILNPQREEIERVAQEEYFCRDFTCTQEDACNSLAIHGIFPHGRISRAGETTPVFLPDFSLGVRWFGFFGRAPLNDRGLSTVGSQVPVTSDGMVKRLWDSFPEVPTGSEPPSSDLECHLCDTLATVHKRANGYRSKYKSLYNLEGSEHTPKGDTVDEHDCIFIDAIAHGFSGHRSLRRDNREVPSVGMNRLLAASATRQSLGKQTISGLLPVETWERLDPPVKHFLLQAGEEVAAASCTPLYPNLPSRDVMAAIVKAVRSDGENLGEDGDGVEYEFRFGRWDFDEHSIPLKQLGLDLAVGRRLGIPPDDEGDLRGDGAADAAVPRVVDKPAPPSERKFRPADFPDFFGEAVWAGKWQADWKAAILEVHSALYDTDIERSLNLQRVLDLYPLHKRVLGLVEHVIVRELKERGMTGGANSVFSRAYTKGQGSGLGPEDNKRATLETEGNWLIFAQQELERGNSDPLDLARTLDDVIAMILKPAASGVTWTINLESRSAADHARHIRDLSQANKAARLISLYLGRLALMLRNAIEHGSDKVDGASLLIDYSGYWKEKREEKYLTNSSGYKHAIAKGVEPVLAWDKDISSDVQWPSSALLSKILKVPTGANNLRLTSGSLHRCMKLASLVLLSSDTHLHLSIS